MRVRELTAHEMELAELLAQGKTNGEIAEETGISVHTVRAHIRNIQLKLGMDNRTQVAVWYATREPVGR